MTMTIGYDNAAGQCVRSSNLDNGHWYQDGEGNLYIVPDNGEIEGPDNDVLEKLNSAYRVRSFYDVNEDEMARNLGLEVVYSWQQRFDPVKGYFAA